MKNTAELVLINNTGMDLRGCVEDAVWAAIRSDGILPEEISDLLVLTPIEGSPGRWRLDAA